MFARRIWLGSLIVLAFLLATSLTPQSDAAFTRTEQFDSRDVSNISADAEAAGVAYPLAMGAQNTPVGEVMVRHDANNLYIEFRTDPVYTLTAAHLCAATAAFGWSPPGECRYKQDSMPTGARQYTFAVPLANIGAGCGSSVFFQAHAGVIDSSGRTGGAYAGTFKGQVSYTVNCCGNRICDLRAGENATTCPDDCRWDADASSLPPDAAIVTAEEFQTIAAEDGFEVVTRAVLDAQIAGEVTRTTNARLLVDELVASNPRLAHLQPKEPQEQPGLRRLGDGNFQLTLGGSRSGESFIVHGTDWTYREIAESLTRTPSRANQEALYRSLIDVLPPDQREDLPESDRLAAVGNVDLARFNQELTRRIEMFVPNEPLDPGAFDETRSASSGNDLSAVSETVNPGSGCEHDSNSIYSAFNWPLKPYTTRVRNQGSRGTCMAFATTAAIETRIWRARGVPTNYSEQELYAVAKGLWFPTANAYGDGLNLGNTLDEMIDRLFRLDAEVRWTYNKSSDRLDLLGILNRYLNSCLNYDGYCSDTNHQMKLVCTSGTNPTCGYRRPPEVIGTGQDPVRLTSTVSLWNPIEPENSLASIRAQLNAGRPVAMTFRVEDEFKEAAEAEGENAGIVNAEEGTGDETGHGVLVVGYVSNDQLPDVSNPSFNRPQGSGGGYLIAKNSWGCDGDGGYMYLSYDWVIDQANSAFAVVDVATSASMPTVTLSTDKSVLTAPGTVRVTASVNSSVTKLQIYQGLDSEHSILGATLPGGSNTTKSVDLHFTQPEQNGVYLFWARAIDQFGNKVISNIVGVNVNLDGTAPQVQLSAEQTIVPATGTVKLRANVSDNVGIARVKFFRGFQLLGQDSTAPYTLTHPVSYADLGTASYVALAYDTSGNTELSNVVDVTVMGAPRPFVSSFGSSTTLLPPAGGQATLTWDVAGVKSLQIAPKIGVVPAQGSATVEVSQTSTFVLLATNSDGTTTSNAVVPVESVLAPLVLGFGSNLNGLPPGGLVITLVWKVVGFQARVFIDQGIGEVNSQGIIQVGVNETKTFTLTATNPGGTVRRSVTVFVTPSQ